MHTFRVQVCWVMVTFCCNLIMVQTVTAIPSTAITYSPPYIESNQYEFGIYNGNIIQANSGANFYQTYLIFYQRVHLNSVTNIKLALSLQGMQYQILDQNMSSSLQLSKWRGMNETGFYLDVTLQYVPSLGFFKCRYLAVNDIDGTNFHFDVKNYLIPMDFRVQTTITLYEPYSSPAPYTQYKINLMMNGFEMVKTQPHFYLNTFISNFNQTHISIALRGDCMFLWQFHYTLVYFKNSLQYNGTIPSMYQTKVLFLVNDNCGTSVQGFGYCVTYDPNTHVPAFQLFSYNYFLGIYDFGTTGQIHFYINIDSNGKLDAWQIAASGIRPNGILFFALQCPQNFYADINADQCIQCGSGCLVCTQAQCTQCRINYLLDSDMINCSPLIIPPSFDDCSFIEQQIDGSYKCKFCDISLKSELISQTQGCGCKEHYFKNLSSNACQQVCGDGIRIELQCDDNNTISNDGCDSQCKLQPGFQCNIIQNPTQCNSTQELFYQIKSITKINGNDKPSGVIVLKPFYNNLPFQVLQKNFYTNNTQMTQINLKLIVNQTFSDLQFDLLKVQNNEIWLMFYYNTTVEGMQAQIVLNYSETRYLNKTQILNFTLKGDNQPFKFSQLQGAYDTVSNNAFVTAFLSMSGLIIGMFVPKFIGLEMIITMQLIFYSQMLIYDFQKWPFGFNQFDKLKSVTGYNQCFNLTQYATLTSISKKYNKLNLHKTIIENFNLNFLFLFIFSTFFYISTFLRSNYEAKIKVFMRENKIKNTWQNPLLNKMSKTYKKLRKFNDVLYWVVSQLSIWCILPLLSALGSQFMISNILVSFKQHPLSPILLKLKGSEFFITFFIILSIGFNHYKNLLVSSKTMLTINERPQELLYKQIFFLYLTVMGSLIFFCNDIKFQGIPISVICLAIQIFYFILLVFIRPYKKALRMHSVALYFNQFLYCVFLVVINLINLIDIIEDFLVLCLGYFVVGCIYLLILLTVVRLYYEIRYGAALENKIQAEREKQKKQKQRRKQQKLKKNVEMKVDKTQKIRDMNKYLLETQIKETQQINLLEWLQHKNWEQEEKQKYFYKKHTQKPLDWLKKKDKEQYEKRVNEMKSHQKKTFQKKMEKQKDPDYIDLANKLRQNLKEKRTKKEELKSKSEKKRRKDLNS